MKTHTTLGHDALQAAESVITSYSIHYTKLYEAKVRRRWACLTSSGGKGVITSYSIHYTKLYDVAGPVSAFDLGRAIGAFADRREGRNNFV